jgi:CheY-like chemotaxis protein
VKALPRLLLVDDDETNLLTLSALLEVEGFEVLTAATAAAALAHVQRPHDIAAALVDHHLGSDDGLALAIELSTGGLVKAVFMLSGDAPQALPSSLRGWLLKGASSHQLVAAVRQHL